MERNEPLRLAGSCSHGTSQVLERKPARLLRVTEREAVESRVKLGAAAMWRPVPVASLSPNRQVPMPKIPSPSPLALYALHLSAIGCFSAAIGCRGDSAGSSAPPPVESAADMPSREGADVVDAGHLDDDSDARFASGDAPDDTEVSEGGGDGPQDEDETTNCTFFDYNTGLVGGWVSSLAFDSQAQGRVYALANGEVHVSDDSGATFAPLAPAGQATLFSLLPQGDAMILASSAGLTYLDLSTKKDTALALDGLPAHTILAHPADPVHVYVGIGQGTVLHSSNGGQGFGIKNQGLPYLDPLRMVGDPGDPGRVTMAAAILNSEGGLSQEGGLWTTEDFGAHWQAVYTAGGRTMDLAQCAEDPQVLWATPIYGGPVRSSDGGRSFEVMEGDLGLSESPPWEGLVPKAIAVGGKDCEFIYIAIDNGGLYRSTDGGQHFAAIPAAGIELSIRGLQQLAVDPHTPDILIAIYAGGSFISHDGGELFSPIAIGFPAIKDVIQSQRAPAELLVASWGSGVWRRPGPDAPFQKFSRGSLPEDYAATAFAAPHMQQYHVGGWPAHYLSIDDGESFQAGAPCNIETFAVDPHHPDTMLAASYSCGALISSDGGLTFEESNLGLSNDNTATGEALAATTILADPQRPGTLYLGRVHDGVYVRTADTDPWQHSLIAPSHRVTCLHDDGSHVYACVAGVGVAMTADGGQTWNYINDGLPTRDVRDLLHDPMDDALYASTGSGLFVRTGEGGFTKVESYCEASADQLALVESDDQRLLVVSHQSGLLAGQLP